MTARIARRAGQRLTLSVLAVSAVTVAVAAPALAAATPQANASAQASNINLPGVQTYQSSSPPTSATNNGSGSTTPVSKGPVGLPSSSLVRAGVAQYETVQAGVDGSSYACAGLGVTGLSAPTSAGAPCTSKGNSITLASIAVGTIPVIAAAESGSDCGALYIKFRGFVTSASSNGTDPPSGQTHFTSFDALPCSAGQSTSSPCPAIHLPLDPAANTDVLAAIISALDPDPDCAQFVAGLQSVTDKVQFIANRQTTSGGVFRVDGLHLATLADSSTVFDFGSVTVGPNSVPSVDTPMLSLAGGSLFALVVLLAAVYLLYRRRLAPAPATEGDAA